MFTHYLSLSRLFAFIHCCWPRMPSDLEWSFRWGLVQSNCNAPTFASAGEETALAGAVGSMPAFVNLRAPIRNTGEALSAKVPMQIS